MKVFKVLDNLTLLPRFIFFSQYWPGIPSWNSRYLSLQHLCKFLKNKILRKINWKNTLARRGSSTVNKISRRINIDEDEFVLMFLPPTAFKLPIILFRTGIKSNINITKTFSVLVHNALEREFSDKFGLILSCIYFMSITQPFQQGYKGLKNCTINSNTQRLTSMTIILFSF